MFPYIHISDKINIPTYGLAFLIGFMLAVFFAVRRAVKEQFNKYDILYASFYALIGIGLGAKLFFFLSRIPNVVSRFDIYKKLWETSPAAALDYVFGGLVFYGGLIGACLGVYIYSRQYKVALWPMVRIYVPFVPFAHAFGRIGCFLAGCCYGVEYHGPLSVQFPLNEFSPHLASVPRFPVQLLEALLNFLCSLVLVLLVRNTKVSARRLFGIYLMYYTVARFILEYLRGDAERGHLGILSTSQVISLFLIPVALFFIIKREKGGCKKLP